jgi:hypothetical protein
MQSGVFDSWQELREMHAETARAAVHAARHADPGSVVGTQGHAICVGDLISTSGGREAQALNPTEGLKSVRLCPGSW